MANRDSNNDFRSVTGQAETAEPSNNSNGSSPTAVRKGPQKPQSSQSSQSTTPTPTPTLRKSSSSNLTPQTASPLAASPHTSRNTSPIRKDKPPTLPGNLSTQPSAAAIQRALSASNVPQLQQQQQGGSVSDAVSKLPRAPKSASASGDNALSWPVSPRLKSPPPSGPNSRRGSATAAAQRRDQPAPPSIEVLSATPQTNTNNSSYGSRQASRDNQRPDPQLQPPPPPKASSRGASGKSMLETVQENSADAQEPSPAAVQAAADLKPLAKISDDEARSPKRDGSKAESDQKALQHGESGSESAENKSDSSKPRGRRQSASQPASNSQQNRPKNTAPKSSYSLTTTKSRAGDGKQGMTVETETVQSIPQSGLAPAGEGANRLRTDNSGSIRLKPSNETIRPKKERKKADRQKRSVNQGTGMSFTAHSPFHLRRLYQDRRFVSAYESLHYNAPRQRKDELAQQHTSFSPRVRRARSMILREVDDPTDVVSPIPQRPTFPQHLKHAISTGVLGTLSDRFVRKATSKADLFEARVANAVDEANTSDSDETFVYESNPPEPQRRGRHHSRTPSVTSSHSMAEQQRGAIRGFGDAFDERRVGGKRSMKFSSNPYNDVDSPESNSGTVRTHTPRHIGRFGRGGHHSATYEQDSPFTQASKLRQQQRGSRPNSPKSPQSIKFRSAGFFSGNRKQEPYDFDTEQNADDERTPLVGMVRGPRGLRNSRRLHSSLHSMEDDDEDDSHWRCCTGRYSACCLTTLVIILVIISAIGFIFSANRPLYNVEIHEIKNVLASEQELFLDLKVGAINPNTLSIGVADMDVNIFAKSKHVGSHKPKDGAKENGRRGARRSSESSDNRNPNPIQDPDGHWHAPGSDDKDSDLEKDAQTMLLGRIFHFDQALSFEASPIRQHKGYSTGQVRLTKPGNKTEIRGSERWEQVINYPFELIVRGVLRYQLPISARVQSAAIGASVMVHPEEGIDDRGNMRLEPIDHSEHWQWIDWPDVYDDDRVEGQRVQEIE